MTRVTSSKVAELLEDLNQIADNWDLFAGQLGVEEGRIKQIRSDNAYKKHFDVRCFSDALHCWVESSDNPTYEDVITVLMGKTVPNLSLAKLINSKHNCNLQITSQQEANDIDRSVPKVPVDLQAEINASVENIDKRFGQLLGGTRESLKAKGVDAATLRACLLDRAHFSSDGTRACELRDISHDLLKADSVEDIFSLVSSNSFWSFFNFHLLEHVITACKIDSTELIEYNKAFEEFCRHKISELPPKALQCDSESRAMKESVHFKIRVYIDNPTLNRICNVKERIAEVLQVPLTALFVNDVQPGCVEVEFLVPQCITQQLFPLTDKQKHSLYHQVHVMRIKWRDTELDLKAEYEPRVEMQAQDGQKKMTIAGKRYKQKRNLFISCLVFQLACIITAMIISLVFVSMFDELPNDQPDDPSSISKQMLLMPSELENIKLVYQGNINVEHNLPYLPGNFFGRGYELHNLTHLLLNSTSSDVNAVVIYGPPAVGKSALAKHAGYELMKLGVNARYIDVQESSIFRDLSEVVLVGNRNVDRVSKPDDSPKASSEIELRKQSSNISIAAESVAESAEESSIFRDLEILVGNRNVDQVSKPDDSPKASSDIQLGKRSSNISRAAVSAEESNLLIWAKNLQKEYLLILDNYDINLQKKFLRKLREASPLLRIVITRQQKAKLMGYKPFPLSFLETEAAIELLRHESSNLNLTDADCRKFSGAVDKSPLALKIAAYILSEDTPIIQYFIDSLKSNPINVLNEDVGLPENSTLLAVLNSAYNRLSDNTRLCGHYISNFPGSFDFELGGRVLAMCSNETTSHFSSECLKELADRSLLESNFHANQKRHNLHQLVRAFIQYVGKATFTVNHSAAVSTSDPEIFNHSFVHSYVDAIDQVLSKCQDHCTDEDGAFIERDNHNIWMAIRTIKYLCHSNRPNLLSFIMKWTQTYGKLSRSAELRFPMTIEDKAEVIGDTLRCLDHLVASPSEDIKADKVLETYTTLVNLAEFHDSGECEKLCKTTYESESRRALLDSLYSARSSTTNQAYLNLKISTLPAFSLFHCRYNIMDLSKYATINQLLEFSIISACFFFCGHRPLVVLTLVLIFYILHSNVFPWYVSLINTIDVTSIYTALWIVSSSFLEYKSLLVLIIAMNAYMYAIVNAKDTTYKNYMAGDIIYHRYGSFYLIVILLLSFLFWFLLFLAVKYFVKFCLCHYIKKERLLSLISYILFCAIPITSYVTSSVIFYFVH